LHRPSAYPVSSVWIASNAIHQGKRRGLPSLCTGISDFNFIFVIFVQTIFPPPSGVKLSTKRGLPPAREACIANAVSNAEMIFKENRSGLAAYGNGQWHGLFLRLFCRFFFRLFFRLLFRLFFRALFDLPGIHIFMF